MIPFPNVSPEIFSIDLFGVNLVLRWYAVSYIVGFFCAIKIMKACIVRNRFWYLNMPVMKVEQADALLTYLILGVIIGGRLGYVLFYNLNIMFKIHLTYCEFGMVVWHSMAVLLAWY